MRIRFENEVEKAQSALRHRSDDDGIFDLFDDHPDLLVPTNGNGPTIYSREEIAEYAFNYYRERGFPYRKLPVHISKQEINALAKCDSLLTTNLGYHVADTYHPHRFHGHGGTLKSPYDSFQIDKRLRRAIRLSLENVGIIGSEYFSMLSVVSGTQACSNFRPGLACYYYKKYCKQGARVLDASTGYGGRLIGFIASGVAGKYYGIDPSTKTYAGNKRMSEELGFANKVKLYKTPAEDFDVEPIRGKIDFCFTSPPYFSKEKYADEPTQSYKRYPIASDWRRGFLKPFLQLQYDALKSDSFALVNIADVKIGEVEVPLTRWCVEYAEAIGFEHRDTENLVLSAHRIGRGEQKPAYEPVFVFYKR